MFLNEWLGDLYRKSVEKLKNTFLCPHHDESVNQSKQPFAHVPQTIMFKCWAYATLYLSIIQAKYWLHESFFKWISFPGFNYSLLFVFPELLCMVEYAALLLFQLVTHYLFMLAPVRFDCVVYTVINLFKCCLYQFI